MNAPKRPTMKVFRGYSVAEYELKICKACLEIEAEGKMDAGDAIECVSTSWWPIKNYRLYDDQG